MNKFLILLKKELRELITVQTIVGVLISLFIFLFLGNVIGDVTKESVKNSSNIAIVDLDQSELSDTAIQVLKQAGYEVIILSGKTDQENLQQAKEHDLNSFVEIPANFSADIQAGIVSNCRIVSKMTSLSIMSSTGSQATSGAVQLINEAISTSILNQSTENLDIAFAKNPVVSIPTTIVGDKQADVDSTTLQSFSMQQTMFIPIIVFILITYATQMTVSTIASEKGDKTLETLLSAPVSRLAVLGSKMCAAGLLSLLMAGVYMIGFSQYMSGMMGGVSTDDTSISNALSTLGLNLSGFDFVLLGIQLFLTILIALAASIILGALSKDVKSAQGLIAPIMFLAMIPYLITMFSDVNKLPVIVQILLYLVPFTHTFTASSNIIFHQNAMFYGGMLYQLILLCVVMFIAVKVFNTDRIFTMTIDFSKKSKRKSIIRGL